MTCARFWPDWIIRFNTRAKRIFTRFQLWAHKPFVKWFPGLKGFPMKEMQDLLMRRYENWDYFPEKVIGLETRSAKLGNIWSVLGADANPNWESMAVWLLQDKSRDQSRCARSQWETSLQCNNVCHWLGTYLDNIMQQWWNMQCNQDIKVDWWCILLTHWPLGDFNSILGR